MLRDILRMFFFLSLRWRLWDALLARIPQQEKQQKGRKSTFLHEAKREHLHLFLFGMCLCTFPAVSFYILWCPVKRWLRFVLFSCCCCCCTTVAAGGHNSFAYRVVSLDSLIYGLIIRKDAPSLRVRAQKKKRSACATPFPNGTFFFQAPENSWPFQLRETGSFVTICIAYFHVAIIPN